MHYFQSVHLYQTSPSYAPQHLHTQVATYAIDNPYHVNGKKIVDQKLKSLRDVKNVRLADKTFAMVVGEKPNYHGVRVGSVKKLENVIKKGGWIFKAQKIKNCLDAVFAKLWLSFSQEKSSIHSIIQNRPISSPACCQWTTFTISTNGVANRQPLTVGLVWLWEEIGFLRTCKQIHREGSEILYLVRRSMADSM
ncbi:hypothetical protein LTS13_000336 [Exophiala xenobiotica]|nr:hypothetical protein LTS13_000336 [Exophiala xenobiotica]KAK5422961.1 hypothetical protein LTR90_001979 [Exophiala xenobiotica]KAK5495487.1 hypothetical protein LTR26_002103 [Exophiala xenobiotica]KAK5514074.1 hypothetical protein LTR07_008105 [Exophiala xenobiotica]